MIQFKYGRYNVQKEFTLSHNGLTRELHPYALVWNNDYYYLIGKYVGKEDMVHLRVDRMVDVNMTDQPFKVDEHFDTSEYMNRLFHMYSGAEKDLKVRMNNSLINVMIDRFGEDVYIEEDGANAFILRTKAIISDGLVKWLLTWEVMQK
ncbi:WYL domain-containing protein [Oceanobacillus sp. 143]|nr:WYL domain-containing protein [Oceanobacillus sp. 143]